jgi:hypothetical protein
MPCEIFIVFDAMDSNPWLDELNRLSDVSV